MVVYILYVQEKKFRISKFCIINVSDKTEFMMCFKQGIAISILNGKPMKLVNQFKYFDSNISSTKSDVNIHTGKDFY